MLRSSASSVAEFVGIPTAFGWRSEFSRIPLRVIATALALASCTSIASSHEPASRLHLAWADEWLTIRAAHLPGGEVRVHYLEAFCRSGRN